MANVGYIRVSSADQNLDRQLEGVPLDKFFEDTCSGTSRIRHGLSACLSYLREGDVLHVHSIDRLARNLKDLQELVTDMTQRGIEVRFHKENLIFSGQDSPMQTLLFQIMGAFAQFERACIRERQLEGIAQARLKGKHLGRPRKLGKNDRKDILQRLCDGDIPSEIAQEYGVSISSIYRVRMRARLLEAPHGERTDGQTQKGRGGSASDDAVRGDGETH